MWQSNFILYQLSELERGKICISKVVYWLLYGYRVFEDN